jgi:hypothetical protein
MSNLLKTSTLLKSLYNLNNYKKITINVIIFCLISLISSCEASEKAEKSRRENETKVVSLIPKTELDSEFFKTEFEKNPPPDYPWQKP